MERPLTRAGSALRQHARHLIQHIPDSLQGKPLFAFAFHEFGALVSLAQYDGHGALCKFDISQGDSIKGCLSQPNHAGLYGAPEAHPWLLERRLAVAGGSTPSPPAAEHPAGLSRSFLLWHYYNEE